MSAIAASGFLLLVLLFAFLLQPPAWVQVSLGVGLVVGSAVFAWLLAKALRGAARRTEEVTRRESTQE